MAKKSKMGWCVCRKVSKQSRTRRSVTAEDCFCKEGKKWVHYSHHRIAQDPESVKRTRALPKSRRG